MVAKDILYLAIDLDTFLDVVVKQSFPLLSVGWYLFRVVIGNRYLTGSSSENSPYTTSTGNVFNTFGNHTTFGFCYDSLNSLKIEQILYFMEK